MDYDALERENEREFTEAARRLYEAALVEARETYPAAATSLIIRRAKATLRMAGEMINRDDWRIDDREQFDRIKEFERSI